MKYSTGQTVKLGDRVSLANDSTGVVVADLDAGEFDKDFPEQEWGYLKQGVVIKFATFGIIHYENLERDLKFVGRAP
jgi:hypothetical protein